MSNWREVLSWSIQDGDEIEEPTIDWRPIVRKLREAGFVVKRTDPSIFVVTPMSRWLAYCEFHSEEWEAVSEERGNEFEQIVSDFGLILGSFGGHPINFDYVTPDGSLTFAFIGNPYHA